MAIVDPKFNPIIPWEEDRAPWRANRATTGVHVERESALVDVAVPVPRYSFTFPAFVSVKASLFVVS